MSVGSPPYVISAASHSAALFRQAFAAPLRRTGVMDAGEFAVTQQTSPNMSVLVAGGRIAIPGTQLAAVSPFSWTPQGAYLALNDGPATVTIAASNPSNPRIDVVYVAVQDAFYSGAANQVVLAVATGTPSASPAVPSIPANAVAVAYVAVGANVTSIVNANITNIASLPTNAAVAVGGITPVASSLTYPTRPYEGMYIDDASIDQLLRWNGTSWEQKAPTWRIQAAQSNSSTINHGAFTLLTSLSTNPVNGGYNNIPGVGNSGGVITLPTGSAGQWEVCGRVGVSVTTAAGMAGAIYQNGTAIAANQTRQPADTGVMTLEIPSFEVTVADGDTFSLYGFAFGAVNFSTYVGAGGYGSYMRLKKIS